MAGPDEHSIEHLPDHCANCGRELTDAEKKTALELEVSPVLCSTCAAEAEPALDPVDFELDQ